MVLCDVDGKTKTDVWSQQCEGYVLLRDWHLARGCTRVPNKIEERVSLKPSVGKLTIFRKAMELTT